MNQQYLQYVREELMVATADLSGATKGQLVAFAENAIFTATGRSRGRKKVYDPQKKRMVNPDGPPMSGNQSHAKGSHIPLVQPVEYRTATWRRAVLSLEEHQKAWLLWNYSDDTAFAHQVTLVQWAWAEFQKALAGRKLAAKTIQRLRQLIWLAAQDVKAKLAGRDVYQYGDLAALVGVNKTNWSQNYVEHYDAMTRLYKRLDSQALHHVVQSRSQQKAANYQQCIA
ncbi:antiterminator [Salmonella enterica]|nr:antiterminator [Salmonella enterica]